MTNSHVRSRQVIRSPIVHGSDGSGRAWSSGPRCRADLPRPPAEVLGYRPRWASTEAPQEEASVPVGQVGRLRLQLHTYDATDCL